MSFALFYAVYITTFDINMSIKFPIYFCLLYFKLKLKLSLCWAGKHLVPMACAVHLAALNSSSAEVEPSPKIVEISCLQWGARSTLQTRSLHKDLLLDYADVDDGRRLL